MDEVPRAREQGVKVSVGRAEENQMARPSPLVTQERRGVGDGPPRQSDRAWGVARLARLIRPRIAVTVLAVSAIVGVAAGCAPPNTGAVSVDAPFASSSPWNTPISTTGWRDEPALRSGHWWVNDEEFSVPVVYANGDDPLLGVQVPDSWGWPGGTIWVRAPADVTGAAGSDRTLVIVSGDVVYTFWQFQRIDDGNATAAAYGQSNIHTGTGWGSQNPFFGAGTRAAGSSGLGGLIRGSDLGLDTIPHALAVSLTGAELSGTFVAPAISQDGGSGSIPMGSRLGIPTGTPMPGGLSAVGRTVWNTLVTYGAFVVDQHSGAAPVILYADPRSVAPESIAPLRGSDLDLIMPFVRVAQ
jgi:hypothetical protein